jgi:hypothetical protein
MKLAQGSCNLSASKISRPVEWRPLLETDFEVEISNFEGSWPAKDVFTCKRRKCVKGLSSRMVILLV